MDDVRRTELAASICEFIETLKRGTDAEAFDVLTRSDLTLTQFRIVMLLMDSDGPQPISEIADQLRLSLATAGRAVDYLVQHKFARRWEDPEDRRSRLVRLTDAGIALTEAPRAAMNDRIHAFAASLQPDAAEKLLAALRQALYCPPAQARDPEQQPISPEAPSAPSCAGTRHRTKSGKPRIESTS